MNYDSAPHNAVNDDDAWATDILDKGESASITFDERGDYAYFCSIHPSMRARIVVR
jgi:plastocyanin